jgi:hypothetical protein
VAGQPFAAAVAGVVFEPDAQPLLANVSAANRAAGSAGVKAGGAVRRGKPLQGRGTGLDSAASGPTVPVSGRAPRQTAANGKRDGPALALPQDAAMGVDAHGEGGTVRKDGSKGRTASRALEATLWAKVGYCAQHGAKKCVSRQNCAHTLRDVEGVVCTRPAIW